MKECSSEINCNKNNDAGIQVTGLMIDMEHRNALVNYSNYREGKGFCHNMCKLQYLWKKYCACMLIERVYKLKRKAEMYLSCLKYNVPLYKAFQLKQWRNRAILSGYVYPFTYYVKFLCMDTSK